MLPSGVFLAMLMLPVFGAALALVFVWRSVRGKRLDDHPVCRRCRFDLSGVRAPVCPECGADLARRRATYRGNRAVSVSMLVGGLALGLLCISVTGVMLANRLGGMSFVRLKPTSWLLSDVESADATLSSRGIGALSVRLSQQQLSASEVNRVVDAIQRKQTDSVEAFPPALGAFVEQAYDAGMVAPDVWAEFLLATVVVKVKAGGVVTIRDDGSVVPMSINLDNTRVGPSTAATYTMAVKSAAIDLLRVEDRPSVDVKFVAGVGGSQGMISIRVPSGLGAGKHRLAVTWRVAVKGVDGSYSPAREVDTTVEVEAEEKKGDGG